MKVSATTRNGSVIHLASDGTFDYNGDALGEIHGVIVGQADIQIGRPFHAMLKTFDHDGPITTSPIVTMMVVHPAAVEPVRRLTHITD